MREPVQGCVRDLANANADRYTVQGDATWWHFDPIADRPFRRQGWKLHVSAAPATAAETLRRAARVVLPHACRWKVARSVDTLIDLCSPPAPLSQVGKFITVYADDAAVAHLAADLHEATKDFDAPVVPSDRRYRRGSNVYLRYGAFAARATYATADQLRRWTVVDDEGRQTEDLRAAGRFAPDWVAHPSLPDDTPRRRTGPGLFGRGIDVLGLLRQSPKGGVYRVRFEGAAAVLKEARIGTCPDLLGRDSRSLLRNEWEILRRLAGTGLAPQPLAMFAEEDNAYLVEEFLPGDTLRAHVQRLNYLGPTDPGTLAGLSHGVRALVAAVRGLDVVPYDLTPNNIIVDGDRFSIIDLEHAGLAGYPEPRFGAWTPGYTPRAGVRRSIESVDLDVTLAAVDHFILTGVDPFLARSVPYGEHVDAALAAFVPDDVLCDEVAEVHARLAGPVSVRVDPTEEQVLSGALAAGRELVRRVEWDSHPWPWPERWSPGSAHPASFMSGTAGIVRFYLDLWQASGERDWLDHAAQLLAWSVDTIPFVAGQSPPGLYFGFGALPWLMIEVAQAGRDAPGWRRRALDLIAAVEAAGVDGWDITHGWAGIGLAQLAVLRATGDPDCRAAAARTMRRVLDGASADGGLPVWDKEGRHFYGFAHGSAGIAQYLLTAGRDLGAEHAVDLAVAIGRTLLGHATPVANGAGVSWRHGPGSDTVWSHWCNGAAGVGAALVALGAVTGEPELLDGAVRAGRGIIATRPFGSCCRCHGLAGDGDFLLDLAALPGIGDQFRDGARSIGRKLAALTFDDGVAPKWAHEGDGEPRPGFMRGYTGIHSFRLRLTGQLDRAPLTLPVLFEKGTS